VSIEFRYRCCEHCVDDPSYHEDEPPDSHTVSCSTGPLSRCEQGDQRVPFDTERNAAVPADTTGEQTP
jgi:hypothetical protein